MSNSIVPIVSNLNAHCNRIVLEAANYLSNKIESKEQISKKLKRDFSWVTNLDLEIEGILVEKLSKLLPESGFITEEETISNIEKEFTWIIDPIDGTTNFLGQLPHFAISIALQHNKETLLGIVYDVQKNDYFHAIKSQGAFLNKKRIFVSDNPSLENSLISYGFPESGNYDLSKYLRFIELLLKRTRSLRQFGVASLDLAYVASGRFDAYFELGLKKWDILAGILLVKEAGGVVLNSKSNHGNNILATNTNISKNIKELIQSIYGDYL